MPNDKSPDKSPADASSISDVTSTARSSIFSFKMLVMLLMGFSSGLPLALTAGTLQAWMTEAGVDLKSIALFALVGYPYALKFLWSPFLDRYVPPFLDRRRGWAVLIQLALIFAIAALGAGDPYAHPLRVALLAVIVTFLAASQDIVVDAYRVEITSENERGLAASLAVLGYRLGMLTSGALALILAAKFSWSTVYLIMSALMAIGLLTTIFAPRVTTAVVAPRTLYEAVVAPLLDFLRRPAALQLLLFAALYKLPDVLGSALINSFLLQTGFGKDEIGGIGKTVTITATILGSIFGGLLMVRLSMLQSLVIFGILQSVSILGFSLLALVGKNNLLMGVTIGLENLCNGMGTAAFTAFLMSLCNIRYTATQYALLTSLMAQCRILGTLPTGWIASAVGWPLFFVIAALSGLPGLLLLLRFSQWQSPTKNS